MMWHAIPLIVALWLLIVAAACRIFRAAGEADRIIEGWRNKEQP